jgi:hypothetical protein
MDADSAQIYLTVEARGTGTTHGHKELGKFRSEILTAIDDMSLSATAVCYHLRKFAEFQGYDEIKRIHWLRLTFQGEFKQDFSKP